MLKKLFMPAVVVIAIAILVLFLDGSVFVIKDVRIEGESGMQDVEVVRLAGLDFGECMRKFDAASVRRNVESTGALICVDVKKEKPSTIVITVAERVPVMTTDYGGSIALMDKDGYVMSVTREMPEGNYLYVTGLDPRDAVPGRIVGADNERIGVLTKVVWAINSIGVKEYISEINVEHTDGIYLYSRTGIQVMLGDTDELENKLIWMQYALIDLEGRGETSGKLDVTGGNQADYRAE